LSLGEFFIVRVRPRSPAAVGELQLIWETSGGVPDQKLASVKLYFLPEHTPAGRQPCHGQVTRSLRRNQSVNRLFYLFSLDHRG